MLQLTFQHHFPLFCKAIVQSPRRRDPDGPAVVVAKADRAGFDLDFTHIRDCGIGGVKRAICKGVGWPGGKT